MSQHSPAYENHLRSPEWRRRRKAAIAARLYRCDRCEQVYGDLEVHHRTYERLGHELDTDLEVLCWECHQAADQERAEQVRRRRWASRVSGWADRVYGDEWECRFDFSEMEAEFERWLGDRDDL